VKAHRTLRLPAYQQLANELRAEIVSGRLRPGDRLPTEPALCVTSGLSRSTVREALRLLASQHLILTTRGVTGGSFVASPSPAAFAESLSTGLQLMLVTGPVDGHQLHEVRRLIEVPVAGLAAQRGTAGDVAALRAALFDPATADLDCKLDAQRAFHVALTAAAGNPLLDLLVQPLYGVANERDIAGQAPPDFWVRVDAEHRAILDAVVRRDADVASALAAAHVDHLAEAYFEIHDRT
jgi:GntR family transcriptional repressor for pyruvate dehydrogenase complex